MYKTLNNWSRDILNFEFLEKGLGIVSPPHFAFFQEKFHHVIFYSQTKFHCQIAFSLWVILVNTATYPEVFWAYCSAASKYYYSAGYNEQKNKKTLVKLNFGSHNKIMNKTSLNKFSMWINVDVLVQVLPLHSFIYISCLVK